MERPGMAASPADKPNLDAIEAPKAKFDYWQRVLCWRTQPVRILGRALIAELAGEKPSKVWRYFVQPEEAAPTVPLLNATWVDERDLSPK